MSDETPPFPLRDRIGSALTAACPEHHCSKQGPAVWAVVSPVLDEQTAEIARLTGELEAAEDLTSRLREDHRVEIAEAEKQIRTADVEIKQLTEQNTLLIAMLERIPEVHMQFHVVDGELAEVCADWCTACRIERAEAERDRLKAANATARELATNATRTGCGAGWDLNPSAILAALDQPAKET